MKVGDVIEIITHYVSKAETLIFEDFLEIARIYFEKLGFVCVPFVLREENGKIKKKPLGNWGTLRREGISWEDIENYWKDAVSRTRIRKRINKEGEEETYKEKTENNTLKVYATGIGALTGSVSAITVVDIDDTERFERTFELKLDELVSTTLAQRTPSGGVHLFYKYDPEIRTGVFKEYGLDIRNDDALIVLYPSYVLDNPEKRYSFINEKVSEIGVIPEKLKKLLSKKKASREKEIETEGKKSVQLLSFKKAKKEEFLKIARILGELYREDKISGHEDIDFALVGGLVEIGIPEENIHEVLREIYGEEYDETLSQYVIDRAKERIERGEKYISLGTLIYKLKQISDSRAKEVLDVLSPKSQFVAPSFISKGGILFKATKEGFSPIAPHIVLKEKLISESETYYLAEYNGKEFILPMGRRERIVEVVENETGISVANLQAFKEFLIYEQTTKEFPQKKLITRTGWDKEVFRIPTIERDEEVWEIPHIEKFTLQGNKDEHFYIINKVLTSGSDLSILLLSALSAPIIHLIDTQPFLVHVSGRPASGKTTACAFAVSVFYNGRDYFTLHSTQNAVEILLSTFRDIPILFDEEELSKDPQFLINLAYMLFSSKGKSRATRSLKVKQNEIRSVVFTTSEHSVEDTLSFLEGKGVVSKLGALRRILHVEMGETFWESIDFKEIENSLKEVWGHFGKLWILWLEENISKVREVYERVKRRMYVNGSEHIFQALWTTKELLQEFMKLNLSNLNETIERYERKQEEKLKVKTDPMETFKREFPVWIASNPTRFANSGRKPLKEPLYGLREGNNVYIFEFALKEFLTSKGLPLSETIKSLKNKGLACDVVKEIGGIKAHVLLINLEDLFKESEQVDNLHEIKYEEGFTFSGNFTEEEIEEIKVRCMENGLELIKEGNTFRIVKTEEEIDF